MIRHDTLGLKHSLQFGYSEADAQNLPIPAVEMASTATTTTAYSKIFAFGDSLTDAGNDYILTKHVMPVSSIYSNGRFTNGPVWVQDLATQLKLPAVTPSLSGGTDFAYGGARTGQEPLHTLSSNDLPNQLAQFHAANPSPSATALYALSIGGNDVLDAVSTYGTNTAAAISDLQVSIANEASFVGSLAAYGAKNFVILNVPDLGKAPLEAKSPDASHALAAYYAQHLWAALSPIAKADHLTIHLVDTFSLIDSFVADPGAHGLTNVTDPVWTGNTQSASSGTLNATGSAQNGYLFFDGLHPTETGHLAIAKIAIPT